MMNQKLFRKMQEKSAPHGLAEKIFLKIEQKQARAARIRFTLFLSVLTVSVAMFVPAMTMLWNDLVQSGSTNFFSMMFTSFSTVMNTGVDFILSFFENLPILSVTMFLFVVFAILLSVYFVQKDLKRVFYNSYILKI